MYFRICEISSRVKFCETILSIFAGLQHDDITFSNYLQTNTSKKTKLKINLLSKQDFVRSLHIEYWLFKLQVDCLNLIQFVTL